MERIGPYRLLGEIARGAAGLVYRAHDDALGREVAIKVLLARGLTTPVDLERFQSEARAAARLRHTGIVAIHSAGVLTGRPYLVLDLIDGPSLHQHIKRSGPLPQRLAAQHAAAIARALHYAHGQGVVHRDVKPANILLADSETPVLTDFGVAKQTGDIRGLTETGEILGTPAYMPPEQAQSRAVGPTSDVYALGATLYHALTGQAPFKSTSLLETLDLIVSTPPVAPSSLRPDLDPDLEQIVLRCLAKDPHDRYMSAAALAGELEGWLEGQASANAQALELPRQRGALIALAIGLVGALALSVGLGLELRRVKAELRDAQRPTNPGAVPAPAPLASAEQPPATNESAETIAPGVVRGRKLLAEGAWRPALDAFARALQADSNDVAALIERGRLWLKLYRGREAVRDLTRAATLRPQDPALWHDLARAYLADGDVPNAKTALAKGIDLSTRTAALYELRATLLDAPAAAEDLTRAIRLQPDLPRLYRQRGLAWLEAGRVRSSSDDLDRYLRSKPDDPLALLIRGSISDDLKHALKLFAHGAQQKGRMAAGCSLSRAQLLMVASPPRQREALADLRRYLLLAPIDEPGLIEAQESAARVEQALAAGTIEQGLAQAQLLLDHHRDLTKAREVLAPLLEKHPRHVRTLELLATIAHEQGDPKRTEALLLRALELHPHHPRLTAALIRECVALNAIERSHELAARALARDPELPQVLLAQAEVYLYQAQHDEALVHLGQALDLDPRLSLAHTARAKVLLAETRWRAAIRELDAAIRLSGHFADLFTRATALARLDQNAQAKADFNRVLLQAPGHMGALLGRADAHRALGERALAIADYQQFLQLFPEAPQARRVQALLREWRVK